MLPVTKSRDSAPGKFKRSLSAFVFYFLFWIRPLARRIFRVLSVVGVIAGLGFLFLCINADDMPLGSYWPLVVGGFAWSFLFWWIAWKYDVLLLRLNPETGTRLTLFR